MTAVRVHNRVLLALVAVATAAVLLTGFVALAPNRLVSGKPVPLWQDVGWAMTGGIAVIGIVLLGSSLTRPRRQIHLLVTAAAAGLIVLLLAALGRAAATLAAGAPPLARIAADAGFWIPLGCAALAIVDAQQRLGSAAAMRLAIVAALAAALVGLAAGGTFQALSLAREYQGHRAAFAAAVLRHILLVAGAVGPAVLIGAPLGIAALRRPRLRGPVFAVLNLLQTIPSIALFGLLIVPLAALAGAVPALGRAGVGGIGVAPALIALVLYALLPVVRSTVAGLGGVDPAVLDAARGMGMSRRQRFWRVELPLAAPVLLAGFRVVTVQAIGLAVVAALIGAGGLGTFVFEGLGQYAVDLVLLGALPTIALALAAEFGLQTATAAVAGRFGR
ncbi:MAG TPA: ABC transporter permease [Stellaceae bacterium]|nr:ABC transporter permease [Stellaceae bacterium]